MALQYLGKWQKDGPMVMKAIKKNGLALQFAGEQYKKLSEYVLEAVR